MKRIALNRGTEKIRLLMFDLDGTLADTLESIREGVNLAMEKYGYPLRSLEEIRAAVGHGARALIRDSMPSSESADEAQVTRVLADYHVFYGETYGHCRTCYAGIEEAVKELKRRGYTLAVLSNKQDIYVKKLAESLFSDGLIAQAVGQTDLPKKPNPTVPLAMAESLGFSAEQTAFIGDSEVDVQTALNAGMSAVGCAWGYRGEELLCRAGAHWILESPDELTELFGRLD